MRPRAMPWPSFPSGNERCSSCGSASATTSPRRCARSATRWVCRASGCVRSRAVPSTSCAAPTRPGRWSATSTDSAAEAGPAGSDRLVTIANYIFRMTDYELSASEIALAAHQKRPRKNRIRNSQFAILDQVSCGVSLIVTVDSVARGQPECRRGCRGEPAGRGGKRRAGVRYQGSSN